jgi:hypothetical protein
LEREEGDGVEGKREGQRRRGGVQRYGGSKVDLIL